MDVNSITCRTQEHSSGPSFIFHSSHFDFDCTLDDIERIQEICRQILIRYDEIDEE